MSRYYAIIYKQIERGRTHVFTSKDTDLVGLIAMSFDARLAYEDVANQIAGLLEYNHQRPGQVYVPCSTLESILSSYRGKPLTLFWKRQSPRRTNGDPSLHRVQRG